MSYDLLDAARVGIPWLLFEYNNIQTIEESFDNYTLNFIRIIIR